MIIPVPAWLIPKHFVPVYLYELLDPRDGARKYIGKTNNLKNRYRAHLSPASLRATTKKNSWIKSLKSKNMRPIMRVVAITTNNWINEAEICEIAGSPNLLNMTGGGDGQCLMSEEVRLKIIASIKKNPRPKKTLSNETRLKISLAHKGKKGPLCSRKEILKKSKPVMSTCPKTGIQVCYVSSKDAARALKTSNSHITGVCKKRKHFKTCKGLFWSYIEVENGN